MKAHLAIAAALALTFPVLFLPANAATPPRVNGYACKALTASMPAGSIWSAAFFGSRIGPFDRRERTHQVRCFKTDASCKAWLYWMQSDWRDDNLVRRCRVGNPY